MIADAIDTLIALGWALLAWIAVAAFVGTVVLLGGTAVGAWAVRGLWRTLGGQRARAGGCAPVSRPEPVSCGSRAAETPPSPSSARLRRTPSWAVTDKEAA